MRTVILTLSLLVTLPAEPLAQEISFSEVAIGLSAPIGITNAGDGSGRLFVILQAGEIVIVRPGEMLIETFLDLRPIIASGGERGLLGLAFHPLYRDNGRFFVNYTDLSGDTVVAEYRVSAGDPDRADPGSARVLLRIDQPFSNHNGGDLHFGPRDGRLWIATGDGGLGGDPGNRAQNPSNLLGKLLRIDVDGGLPYAIPPDNPYVNGGGAPEVWAIGLRNPWRFSFDPANGDLLIGDVGQNSFEEIDWLPAPLEPANFGWRVMEGLHCFNPPSGCSTAGLTLPILEYGRTSGCSVTGGHVYRGLRSRSFRGTYFYGDYCSGRIWGARQQEDGSWTTEELANTTFLISAFGVDEGGEIHVADHRGAIHRIVLPDDGGRRRAVRRTP
ncbi:MAG TPA: PQQ-dependent sugar dehydrogenase [Thermoanaerobaculia bacterium]|nr:PQQ-dependent sugar dehydrogenase [Thermoanaerobaculia bacterium]